MHEKPRPGAGLLWEILMPWVSGVAGCLFVIWCPTLWMLGAAWKDSLLDKVVAACSIFVAYLVTVVTVIPAIEEKSIIRRLQDWGYFKFIIRYLRDAVWSTGLLLLLSLAAIPIPSMIAAKPHVDQGFSALWWGVFCLASPPFFEL